MSTGLDTLDLATEHALRELSVRYASAIDRRDPAALRDLFVIDGRLVIHRPGVDEPVVRDGADDVAATAQRFARYRRTFYLLGQSSFATSDEDGVATGEVYCVGHHVSGDDQPRDFVNYVRYHDEYVVDRGAWRFRRRDCFIDLETTGLHVAAVRDAAGAAVYGTHSRAPHVEF